MVFCTAKMKKSDTPRTALFDICREVVTSKKGLGSVLLKYSNVNWTAFCNLSFSFNTFVISKKYMRFSVFESAGTLISLRILTKNWWILVLLKRSTNTFNQFCGSGCGRIRSFWVTRIRENTESGSFIH